MSCDHLVSADGTVIGHICRPNGERRLVGKRRRKFWCFGCRKRTMHSLMRFFHTQPSWYEDWLWWECPECHQDNRSFPGCG